MKNFAFDIETVALDTEILRANMPAFDPDSIKTGNMKDEAKIAEKIEKARREQFERYFRKAALSALTGQIAMIGVRDETGPVVIEGSEPEIIKAWFDMFESLVEKGGHWIGFNIQSFDIPFIIRRAWFHRIKVPYGITRGRYLTSFFTDLLAFWNLSEYVSQFDVSLADLANYFGLGAKTANGADFGELLRYDPTKARIYLETDLELTWNLAERMGALRGPPVQPVNDQTGPRGNVKSCPGIEQPYSTIQFF